MPHLQSVEVSRPRPLMSTEEAAERLGVSSRTVRRLINSGDLPAVKVGKLLRIVPEDLEAWIAKGGGGAP